MSQVTQAASPFVDATTLSNWLADGCKLTLLDARFDLATADPAVLRGEEVISRAIHIDVTTEAGGEPGPTSGRLPLPDIAILQRDVRRWGIDDDTTVVVYDEAKGTSAARVWWVLRWAGLKSVHILDGGIAAWRAAGLETKGATSPVRRGKATLRAGHLPSIDAARALTIGRHGVLIDARGREAYEGQADQPGTGHIPGAYSIPTGSLQTADGRVKAPAILREIFSATGAIGKGAAAYCGSGVAAAYVVAALQTADFEVSLYPGSWSEWIKDAERPVVTGLARS